MQREQQARRELEEHQRRLADEVDRAVAQTGPSPWLKPRDPGDFAANGVAVDAIRRKTPTAVSWPASPLGRLPPRRTPDTGRIFLRDDC
jgi:hypothetical protein